MIRVVNRLLLSFAGKRRAVLSWAVFTLVLGAQADDFQGATHMMPFEEDTINYNNAATTGAVTQLQKRIETGAATLQSSSGKMRRRFGTS